MTTTLGVGIIGVGNISTYYVNAIKNNQKTTLVSVCDVLQPNPDKFSGIKTYTDIHLLLQQTEPPLHVIVISTPPSSHFPLIQAALKAGKKVIVEKPVTVTMEEAKECLSLDGEKRGLYLAYHSAFQPVYLHAKKIILNELNKGDVITYFKITFKEMSSNYHNGNSWVYNPQISGGGCLIDSGINALSLIQDLVGELTPTKVEMSIAEGYKVETKAHVQFKGTKNTELTGELEMDWLFPGTETREVIIKLKSGTVISFDPVPSEVKIQTNNNETKVEKVEVKEEGDRNATPMSLEYKNLLEDALDYFEGKKDQLGLLPYDTVMQCYGLHSKK